MNHDRIESQETIDAYASFEQDCRQDGQKVNAYLRENVRILAEQGIREDFANGSEIFDVEDYY